jgi:putative ABC transport system permease protein
VRFHNNLNQEKLLGIKDQINSLFPEMKADPEYLTDRFDNLYKKEKRLGVLLSVFSFLAIFIASIGLLGLTIFTTKKESKNIAIRKVNGASSLTIWKLLIRGYVKLIAMALIIAVPISYYILEKWLQSFAYRTMVEWWIFIAAGVLALIISLLTVSWYSLKASRRNPVVSLRYE